VKINRKHYIFGEKITRTCKIIFLRVSYCRKIYLISAFDYVSVVLGYSHPLTEFTSVRVYNFFHVFTRTLYEIMKVAFRYSQYWKYIVYVTCIIDFQYW